MKINKVKNIITQNIVPKLRAVFQRNAYKPHSQPPVDCFEKSPLELSVIKSSTVEKLFSPEYTPKSNRTDLGLRVTTVIDKRTNKPVEAYVAMAEDGIDSSREKFILMVKDKKGEIQLKDNRYKVIGSTYYYINDNMITPKIEIIKDASGYAQRVYSYMISKARNKYRGVGIRLHQIKAERMFQLGLDGEKIVAQGNSFPFHYKLGFRMQPQTTAITNLNDFLNQMNMMTGISKSEISKHIVFSNINNKQVIDVARSTENLLNSYYKNGNKELQLFMPDMYLSENAKSDWLKLTKLQPILI